jgi:hypothetical protein
MPIHKLSKGYNLDTKAIIVQLEAERDRLDQAIDQAGNQIFIAGLLVQLFLEL